MLGAEGSGKKFNINILFCTECTCTAFVFYFLCDSFSQEVGGSKFKEASMFSASCWHLMRNPLLMPKVLIEFAILLTI